MRHELEDFRMAWHAQPTTFFHLAPQEMRAVVERIDRRQRRIARGVVVAFVGDVIAFTLILLFLVTNALQAAGCVWIMIAMGWFARRLWAQVRGADRTHDEMVARPSIDAFRASLETRWAFYQSLLSFGAVLPGVAIFVAGFVVAQPASAAWAAVTGVVILAGTMKVSVAAAVGTPAGHVRKASAGTL